MSRRNTANRWSSGPGRTVPVVEGLHLPLLLVGYASGALFYVGAAVALWRAARRGAGRLVALYWRRRARREAVATIRRVKRAQELPERRAA